MNPITKAWLDSAQLDLDCIQHIIGEIHLTPPVAYHSQQTIEKCLKAVLEEHQESIGKTHNLITLWKAVAAHINLGIEVDILTTLNDLYVDSRYPGDLGLLPEGKPSVEDANEFYEFAKDIYSKISRYLETKK